MLYLFVFDKTIIVKKKVSNLKGSRFISVVGCNHQRTVSAFNQGVYLLFSPASLTFKSKVLKKNNCRRLKTLGSFT